MVKASADLMHEIVSRLVTEFDPDQIILFGSQAWGEPGEDSDVDLLVVVPESKERPIARAVRAHRCLRGIPVPMDLLVRTRDEMDRMAGVSSSLEAEVLRRGKPVYGRSEESIGPELAPQSLA
jgi:predicted nucleotidyltransferase